MTSFGINNNGHLVFDYYHEDYGDNSVSGQLDVYNGKDSVLWVNFSQAFADDIKHTYQSWRGGSNPLLSYDKVVENFITNHSDKWSISIYNEDAEYKYISMYRNGELKGDQYLYQVRGTGEEHLKYFIKNRLMYCDSKWQAGDFINKDTNTIILRINAPDISTSYPNLQPSTKIEYTTFSNMYAGVGYGAKAGVTHWAYTERGKSVWFERNEGGQNDLDTYIFGASEISSLDDLSLLYCGDINVSAASKLTRLIIGSTKQGYTNENLKSLSLSNNRLLREINVCNCIALKTTLDFSLCPDIQEIYAQGSGITGVILPTSGFLKKMHLPRVSEIIITNQNRIEEFTCEGYNNLSTLKIENSTMVVKEPDGTIIPTERFPLQEILLGCDINLMATINIKNIKWNVDSEENLSTIINKLIQKQGFVLEGSVYVLNGATVSDKLKVLIHQHFPKLNVIDNDPLFYVDYYNYKGELWDTEPVRQGHNAVGPSKGNPSDVIMDAEGERHLFVEWNNLPTNVQQNCTVNAKWQTKYAVYFHTEDGTSQYHTGWYNKDEAPEDPVVYGTFSGTLPTGKIYEPTKVSGTPDSLRYKFNGWATSPNSAEPLSTLPVITGVTDFYATFIEQYPVRFKNESACIKEEWVIKGQSATPPSNPTKASTAQYDYKFKQWAGDYTNVTGPRDITAKYDSIPRKYTVYFCNGDGVLHTARDISYGSTATYSGEPPVKQIGASDIYESSDYEWTQKWSPVPMPHKDTLKTINKGTANEETAVWCYPVFRFTKLNNDDWDIIADRVASWPESQLFETYPIGTRKHIDFTIDGKTYSTVVEIIAHNHDNLTNGSKAKLTFFTKELPDLSKKIGSETDKGWGYGNDLTTSSELRLFLQTDVFNALPSSLQSAIKTVKKKYNNGYDPSTNIVESEDKCWLISDKEAGLIQYKEDGTIDHYLGYAFIDGQGQDYKDTFTDNQSRLRFVYGTGDKQNVSWWTRSAYKPADGAKTNMFWYVTSEGYGTGANGKTYSAYVAFGFCI